MGYEIVTGEFCASYYASYTVPGSKPDTEWHVSHDGILPPHCDCPAFMYYKGDPWDRTCKHINYVWNHACMWNCQWHEGNKEITVKPDSIDEGNVIKGSSCPNCGGPVVAVKIAV